MIGGQTIKIYKTLITLICFLIIFAIGQSTGWTAGSGDKNTISDAAKRKSTEEKWGVKVLSIRLTAAGKMLDYRFRVADPEKAVALMQRGDKAYLIDQATGKTMPVPRTKIGPLRQTGSKPKLGAVYPIVFMNLGGVVKPGSKVTVVLGDFRVENLIVGEDMQERTNLAGAKQTKWEAIQKKLRNEMAACIEDCGQDRDCFEKCEKTHKSRLDREYQQLLYEN